MAKKRIVEQSEPMVQPAFNSTDWTDYVMSLFNPDELADEKYPKFVGLLRVAEVLGFQIIKIEVDVKQCPATDNNRRATAISKISYYPPAFARNGTVNTENVIFEASDAADCSELNTRPPFAYHPVATASTMAQARTLRKILRMNTHAAEEMQLPDESQLRTALATEEGGMRIAVGQVAAITGIAGRLGIDISKLIVEHLPIYADSVSDATLNALTEPEAALLLRRLNGYQKNSGDKDYIPIPQSIIKGK